MRPIAAALASVLLLAACEQAHDGQEGGAAGPPADAPAPAPSPVVYPADMDLAGTEPFWAVKIRGGTIAFTRPDAPERDFTNAAKAEVGDTATWTANDAKGSIVVKLTAGTCSDGMSDKVWGYSAVVTVGEETLKGCGEIPPAPSAAQG